MYFVGAAQVIARAMFDRGDMGQADVGMASSIENIPRAYVI
jgi:hypothetical protein